MVKKQQSKRQRNIKSKLMAAICMLLVSTIMMVSSTYAWFTLSTAPEVTGITTAVGANGNLEMALMPKEGGVGAITSQAGDSTLGAEARNVTWGNLVDLSDASVYGLDRITLYPSALNLGTNDKDANGNPTKLNTSLLSTPTYGSDGRVSELVANTFTGYYNSATRSFAPDNYKGVRAVGTASGMTDRQLDYRNARSAANSATAYAKTLASQSLNANGSNLANIAITHGMGNDDDKYDKDDVAALRTIINDLNKTEGILDQIETAYMQYILAYAASAANGAEDAVWNAVKAKVEADDATLTSVTGAISGLPSAVTTAISEYNETVAAVSEADTKLKVLETELASNSTATFDWGEISSAMTPLANASVMKVNGFDVSAVKANLGELVSSVTSQGGLVVTMPTGGGVYADIADQCGDFTASVNIERVEYTGIVLNNMGARMETKTTVNPNYLSAIGTAVEEAKAPGSGETGTLPISDMYGYIVDLAFRTNAAQSDLLLAVEARDRIYSDNTNDATMGHGSSMTFKATATDFTDQQVKDLMSAIRIIFFNPDSLNVIATAKLDAANATQEAAGWTAKMYLYELTAAGGTTYVAAGEGETATHIADATAEDGYRHPVGGEVATHVKGADGVYTEASDGSATHIADPSADRGYRLVKDGETATHVKKTTTAGEKKSDDNVIMPLTQNQAAALSVLVYLDGNNVGNDDVAATAASSMTGTMNLQFASSANLVPMEYAALYQSNATTYTVTKTIDNALTGVGISGEAKATAGKDYTFTLTGTTQDATYVVTYAVGSGAETPLTATNGNYTIPSASVTDNITIKVAPGT